jgi:hypothetical protein
LRVGPYPRPSSGPYSPKCLEEEFSEVTRIHTRPYSSLSWGIVPRWTRFLRASTVVSRIQAASVTVTRLASLRPAACPASTGPVRPSPMTGYLRSLGLRLKALRSHPRRCVMQIYSLWPSEGRPDPPRRRIRLSNSSCICALNAEPETSSPSSKARSGASRFITSRSSSRAM